MGEMNGTWHSISMVVIIIFILAASGVINMTSLYEAGEPSLPSTVTVCDRSISLRSEENNIENALGYVYEDGTDCFYSSWGIDKKAKLVFNRISDNIYIYYLDPFGYSPENCSIYNGVTTASTKEDLETAFGEDCIKTDSYYAEIFIDDNEVDYTSTDCPNNEELEITFRENRIKNDSYWAEFHKIIMNDTVGDNASTNYPKDFYDMDFSIDKWFEAMRESYPEAEYITLLMCRYSSNSHNEIRFYIYDQNAIEEF